MTFFISVIIPVYNGGQDFGRCLQAINGNDYGRYELIVIEDGSTDHSAEMAQRAGAQVVASKRPKSGPAACRNLGATVAKGDLLVFLDADVLIQSNTLSQIAGLMADETVAACFGSYNNTPTSPNFLSQYRNLLHHYTHQVSNPEASTFWAGCGAIRRELFLQLGGFNATRYPRPSIEDIELGYRLKQAGHRIWLEKSLQVTHLKQWTAVSLLRTDIFNRALPWSQLVVQSGNPFHDLNLQWSQRLSAGLVWGGITAVFVACFFPAIWLLVITSILALLFLNHHFYQFLYQKKGFWFVLRAIPWHWLYFLYSSFVFAWCKITFYVSRFYVMLI